MRKLKIILLGAQLLLGGADSRITRQHIQHGAREDDPLGRPFVHNPTLYATNAALSLGCFWLGKKLEKRHPKLSLVPQMADVVGHTWGYAYSRAH